MHSYRLCLASYGRAIQSKNLSNGTLMAFCSVYACSCGHQVNLGVGAVCWSQMGNSFVQLLMMSH